MADHLALIAAHLRTTANSHGAEAQAGASLMQVRAHLEEGAWRRWVERDVKIDLDRAHALMAAAERSGASIDTLRPREI